tara:strand:- start:370 stop:735 length:366 start_codon:yes stop_codon:yes gene_type:complete
MRNTPDDWNNFYSNCHECGDRTHASEGHACSCAEREEEIEEIEETTDDKHVIVVDGAPVIVTETKTVNTDCGIRTLSISTTKKNVSMSAGQWTQRWILNMLTETQKTELSAEWLTHLTKTW